MDRFLDGDLLRTETVGPGPDEVKVDSVSSDLFVASLFSEDLAFFVDFDFLRFNLISELGRFSSKSVML